MFSKILQQLSLNKRWKFIMQKKERDWKMKNKKNV